MDWLLKLKGHWLCVDKVCGQNATYSYYYYRYHHYDVTITGATAMAKIIYYKTITAINIMLMLPPDFVSVKCILFDTQYMSTEQEYPNYTYLFECIAP